MNPPGKDGRHKAPGPCSTVGCNNKDTFTSRDGKVRCLSCSITEVIKAIPTKTKRRK